MTFRLTMQDARPNRRQKAGARAEMAFEAILRASEQCHEGWYFRVSTDWQVVGGTPEGCTVVPKRKSGPDYLGVLKRGQFVAFEVKHVQGKRRKNGTLAACRFELASLAPHQVRDLSRIASVGGLAWVAVVHGQLSLDGALYLVPISVVQKAMAMGWLSLTSEHLVPYKVHWRHGLLGAMNPPPSRGQHE